MIAISVSNKFIFFLLIEDSKIYSASALNVSQNSFHHLQM